MKIDNEVLAILARSTTNCNALHLPEQLDRKLYVKVNKVLEALGWKWNRQRKAHLVGESIRADAQSQLESVILTGEVRFHPNELQQFFSPIEVVEALVDAADLLPGHSVLEPSSGEGAIAKYCAGLGARVTCFEIDPKLAAKTREVGLQTIVQDFLTMTPSPIFDRVIMNPPFTKRQEAAHVLHALQFLKPGGRLVSVMSAGIEFRECHWYRAVRDMVTARGGAIARLPQGSFSVSGTEVNTCLVSIEGVRDNTQAVAAPRVTLTPATPTARAKTRLTPPVQSPEEFTLVPRQY